MSAPLPLVALVLLAAPLLAGCLTSSLPPAPDAPGAASQGLFRPVCGISNWADACTARASPNDSPAKTEIDLAINPMDPLNVVVGSKDLDPEASNCVWAVPQVTKDGGRTWTTVYVGGTRAERMADPTHPLFGWECITDPIMLFDQDGILYYPLQAYNMGSGGADCPGAGLLPGPVGFLAGGCGSAFYLAVSTDGGATYPRIIPMAFGDGGAVFHDYPRMVLSPTTGAVHTVWNAVGGAGINPYVVSTRDQGQSVDRPTIVAAPDAPRSTAFTSGFAAGSDGTIYMSVARFQLQQFFVGGGGDTFVPDLAVSTDDARSFGGFLPMFEVTPISCPLPNTEFRCGTSIELAADASGGERDGRLYAVWDDARRDTSDIMVAWSDDQGQSWGEPVLVNQDPTDRPQFMARPKVGPDGTLHVLYLDRAFDPNDVLYDATYAYSTDGGTTWANVRLTSVSSDGDLGVHQNGFPFIGDYNGIDVAGDHVWMGFPSTVTGRAEIAVAHVMKAPRA